MGRKERPTAAWRATGVAAALVLDLMSVCYEVHTSSVNVGPNFTFNGDSESLGSVKFNSVRCATLVPKLSCDDKKSTAFLLLEG